MAEAYNLISSYTFPSNQSNGTFTLSNIPQDHKHLVLVVIASTTQTNDGFDLRINNISTSTYNQIIGEYQRGGSASAYNYSSNRIFFSFLYGSMTNGKWSSYEINIHDYSSSGKNKPIFGISGLGSQNVNVIGASESSLTDPVTSISINYGTFVQGTTVILYGIKG